MVFNFYHFIIILDKSAEINPKNARGDQPMYFENFDLENIVSPVNVPELEKLLIETKYNPSEIEFLVDGFTNRFSIGYQGKIHDIKVKSKNLRFNGVGNDTIL